MEYVFNQICGLICSKWQEIYECICLAGFTTGYVNQRWYTDENISETDSQWNYSENLDTVIRGNVLFKFK